MDLLEVPMSPMGHAFCGNACPTTVANKIVDLRLDAGRQTHKASFVSISGTVTLSDLGRWLEVRDTFEPFGPCLIISRIIEHLLDWRFDRNAVCDASHEMNLLAID
jgi:hypothetical protein